MRKIKDKEALNIIKRGYLKNDFEYFHIKDKKSLEFDFHYHDFNKIIIFISGNVTYLIEGKAYKLKPWDILLVGSNEIHKPLIEEGGTYERIILWVNSSFLTQHNSKECNLLTCFEIAAMQKFNLMRLNPDALSEIKYILFQLEKACYHEGFGKNILKNALFIQFIVSINRAFLARDLEKEIKDVEYDENIVALLNYINDNLSEELTIEELSLKFYMNKYYLMHKFKKQTGYTLHNYILQKRLILASSLIKKGIPITEVYIESGFSDYSNFIRAFKSMFGLPPKKYYKAVKDIESLYHKKGY